MKKEDKYQDGLLIAKKKVENVVAELEKIPASNFESIQSFEEYKELMLNLQSVIKNSNKNSEQ